MPNLTTRALLDMRAVNEAARRWPSASSGDDFTDGRRVVANEAFLEGVRWALDEPAREREAKRRADADRKRRVAERAWAKR